MVRHHHITQLTSAQIIPDSPIALVMRLTHAQKPELSLKCDPKRVPPLAAAPARAMPAMCAYTQLAMRANAPGPAIWPRLSSALGPGFPGIRARLC